MSAPVYGGPPGPSVTSSEAPGLLLAPSHRGSWWPARLGCDLRRASSVSAQTAPGARLWGVRRTGARRGWGASSRLEMGWETVAGGERGGEEETQRWLRATGPQAHACGWDSGAFP